MLNNLNITLNNFGRINNANIDIGKINIIGGLNSTGKSTCSKILYSILRSNSKTRKAIVEDTLEHEVYDLTFEMLTFTRNGWRDDADNNDTLEQIREIVDQMNSKIESKIKNKLGSKMEENIEKFKIENIFDKLKEIYKNSDIKDTYKKILDTSFDDVQKLFDVYEEDSDELFKTILNQLIKREFGKDISELNDVTLNGDFSDNSIDYKINIANSEFDISGWFIIEDVFYFDSFSAFDLLSRGGSQNTEHISHVFDSLNDDESEDWGDEILNKKIINIENRIMDITGGRFERDDHNILFKSSEKEFLMKNTSSGIKQLGIIQMLLNTRHLSENSFLIMDEPEVNLHPDWQAKLANILVLLAKELNITIYINSHSPLFIEAMKTYSQKYGLLDETNFYLSYESDVEGKYDIVNIPSSELNIIYNTLGKPYELLSEISIRTEFGL